MNKTKILTVTILFSCQILLNTSCRKVYHNCECAFINADGQADNMLISVRAANQAKASKECSEAELRISANDGIDLFCTLQR